jgi:hypothetical protein
MAALARGPFDAPRAGGTAGLPPLALRSPAGELSSFPRTFAWIPAPDADLYEITVVSAADGRALFRQRGDTAHLELTFDPGAEPPPGAYVWEVRAYRRGVPCARGTMRFEVRPTPAAPASPATRAP